MTRRTRKSSATAPFLAAFLAAGCAADGAGDPGSAESQSDCEVGSDELGITGSAIDGRVLQLEVEYVGGCEEHAFDVWWGGVVATSDPPIVPLELQHYARGDTCDELVEQEIAVDLSAIEEVGPAIRVQIVMGRGGARTLLESLYEAPAGPSEVPADALPIDTSCGTIEN